MDVVVFPWVPATEPPLGTGEHAQHLGPLLDFESVVAEIGQFLMGGRDGGRIDHQGRLLVTERSGDERRILLVMKGGPLADEFLGQLARRTVVTAHFLAFRQEVTDQRAHADAAGADEIDSFQSINIHGS